MNERKKNPIVASKVRQDDLMAFIYFAKIKKNVNGIHLSVQDIDNNSNFSVNGSELIESALSADYFAEEEKVTKTHLAEILINSSNRPFTVCFDKADGTERTLRGRLIAPEPLLGRSTVEDLDVETGNRMRLVDHRTLKWMVVDGVKYIVNYRYPKG